MDVEGLEDVIVKRARSYATAMAEAVSRSHTEEDIRIESERQLALIEQHANITLDGRHEFTVASGRADSVYDRVVIEYKNPHSRADQIGSETGSGGTKKVVAQIKDRLGDLVADYGQPVNSLLGVGLDGRRIVFVRFRERQWQVQHPVELNHRSAERFIRALFNLGTRGKPFTPDYLSSDFGAESSMAQDGIRALYESITTTSDARAHTLFDQWRIMFSEVCGYEVDDRSNKMLCLAKSYEIDQNDLRPAELLFALHTYYAIFMKLLAAEIVAFFHELPSPLQKLIKATTSAKLKRELKDLESGGIFRHLNITNFLEGDLFAWYVSAWSVKVEDLVRKMTAALDDYNPGTLSEDPLQSRDLLKKLYHHLFPRSVRHDLGEYYTPGWLADHVLEELGYEGDPRLRLLDPACGSGTFLVMAINRIRRWHDENREDCGLSEGDICDALLKNVVGFDLNPLAVMAARTNYLIAIRDLLRYVDRVEIPIYLCDSVATPAEYGDLFSGAGSVARVPCSAVRPPYLFVPKEIAATSEHVATYARLLEHGCVLEVRVTSS